MAGALRIAVDSDLDQVALVGRAVRALCAETLSPDDVDAVELAMTEALNNVILHGYEGRPGHALEIALELRRGEVRIEISDEAPPMPEGLLSGAPDAPFAFDADDLEALPEGGMGLALIRLSMDEVAYRRADGRNRLRMVKRRSAAEGG